MARTLGLDGERTYYGELGGKLYGDNLGVFAVDEAFKRVLDKHEDHLVKTQAKIIADLRRSFADETKDLVKNIQVLSKRISDLEKKACK